MLTVSFEPSEGDDATRPVARSANCGIKGCVAAGYRLAGEHLQHVCCRHLYGNDRLLTAWPSHDEVVVILIAPHNRAAGDVYDLLLDALDVDVPIDQRDKPSCCDEAGEPPGDEATAQAIVDAIETVAKQRRRR